MYGSEKVNTKNPFQADINYIFHRRVSGVCRYPKNNMYTRVHYIMPTGCVRV